MRPKKQIILLAAHCDRASELSFLLTVHGFAVTVADSAAHATELLPERAFDLLLCEWPMPGIESLLSHTKACGNPQRSLLLAFKTPNIQLAPLGLETDYIITAGEYSSARLIDRVKTLSAHKPGPKPAKKPVVSVAVFAADRRIA